MGILSLYDCVPSKANAVASAMCVWGYNDTPPPTLVQGEGQGGGGGSGTARRYTCNMFSFAHHRFRQIILSYSSHQHTTMCKI